MVIESKTQVECRILLNRADLLQLNHLEWCICQNIIQKSDTRPIILDQIEEYCEYLDEIGLKVVKAPKSVYEMEVFVTKVSPIEKSVTPHIVHQLHMYAVAQLAEIWDSRRKARISQEVM